MTQQRAPDADVSTTRTLDAQSGRPLAERQSGERGKHGQIQKRHENGEQDSGGLGRITRRTSTAAEHTRDERA
jgi:hypothetical protein